MKLTTFLLLTACLTASAGGYTQTVSLSVRNAPLEKVFKQIKKQTGYEFLYTDELLQGAKPVSIEVRNGALTTVLDQCFSNQPVTYTIIDKTVVIKKRDMSPAGGGGRRPGVDVTPPIDIRGRVTNEAGEPVAASIVVKGTNQGTTTNNEGYFELKGVDENAVLVISGVSIETREVRVNNQRELMIAATTKVTSLNEVVINKGYYTEKQKYSVGNVGKVTAKDIEKQPVSNPLLALQGRVPGVYITQSTGMPGSGVVVRIQGKTSINSGNDPLYIIDGVPYSSQMLPTNFGGVLGNSGSSPNANSTANGNPLNFINAADIESIEILKDADATAIYGSRAANGAILITTKKGKAGTLKVNLKLQSGIGQIERKLNMLNTQQYLEMRQEAIKNDGATVLDTDYDINGTWDKTKSTDWQDQLFKTARYNDAQMSISGGSLNTQYLISAGFHHETTVYPGDFSDKKGSLHYNINTSSNNQKFKIQLSGLYLIDNNSLMNPDIASRAFSLPPNAPELYNRDGSINWSPTLLGTSTISTFSNNPAAELLKKFKSNGNNFLANSVISYRLSKGVAVQTNLGYTNLQTNDVFTEPLAAVVPEERSITPRSAGYSFNRINSFIIEPQINFERSFRFGKFEAIIGSSVQKLNRSGQSMAGIGYNNDLVLEDIKSAASITTSASINSVYRYNAIFARTNFISKDKFILNFTARRDGSSRFGEENLFQNFASLGGGWIFSNEDFLKNIPSLSFGKLTLSYGTTGNDQIGDYQYLNLYNPFNTGIPYQGSSSLMPNQLTNPYLQWELTRKLKAGVDVGLFRDRIFVSASYSRNRSSNQLLSYVVPISTGFNSVLRNLPATVQNLSWEFAINSRITKSNNFSWTNNINFTVPKNKLLSFDKIETTSYNAVYVVGEPITIVKTLRYAGIDDLTGRYQFYDATGNITLTPNSTTDRTVLINTAPKFYGGFQNSFTYKSLQVDFLIQFVKQLGSTSYYGGSVNPGYNSFNQPTSVLNRWQKPGDGLSSIQRFSNDFNLLLSHFSMRDSDIAYVDASFAKLRNLSISWQLPTQWRDRVRLIDCRLFVQGQNLFTITNYDGLDPETQTVNSLPPLRIVTMGLSASF